MTLRNLSLGLAACGLALCVLPASALTVTFVDLHPVGATFSVVKAVNGSNQLGMAEIGGHDHALLWNGSAGSFVDLNIPGQGSQASALSGSNQIGGATPGAWLHAGMWSGTAGSFVDLNPSTVPGSFAYAASSTQQGGYTIASASSPKHAALWSGTAGSHVSLHPAGATASELGGMSDSQQVGDMTTNGAIHAVLWHGTAASVVDLHPAGASSSSASAANDSQQVGVAVFGGAEHAVMWYGTSAVFVDMNPPGAISSRLHSLSGSLQAGSINFQGTNTSYGTNYAALWSGTPGSCVNLGTALGTGYTNSFVFSVWTDGRITYVAGFADTASGERHAMLWTIKGAVSLQMLPGNLAGIVIDDAVGAKYRLDSKTNLSDSSWLTLTNVTLPTQPYTFIDYDSPGMPRRFYRALPQYP